MARWRRFSRDLVLGISGGEELVAWRERWYNEGAEHQGQVDLDAHEEYVRRHWLGVIFSVTVNVLLGAAVIGMATGWL